MGAFWEVTITPSCSALGPFEHCTRAPRMNGWQEQHYLAWARRYFETVRGRIGYGPGRVLHLWHGEVADRRFGCAIKALRPSASTTAGWRWSSDKTAMHAFIRRYFETRDEDGRATGASAVAPPGKRAL
jgi:hypothetical protein